MKTKTSELTDAALDWAVAKSKQMKQEGFWLLDDQNNGYLLRPHFDGMSRLWSPSTVWSQGGPIIEREGIGFVWEHYDNEPVCVARIHTPPQGEMVAEGPTPLIAAMRCFVASKLGDEVEVPDGLV